MWYLAWEEPAEGDPYTVLHNCADSLGVVCSRISDVGRLAGILLYLLDIAFRLAQQVQPVVVSNVSACKSATLATMHFNADPHTPIKPIQVWCSRQWRYCFTKLEEMPAHRCTLWPCSVLGYRMQGRFRCISLYMQCQQGFQIYVEDCLSQAFTLLHIDPALLTQ